MTTGIVSDRRPEVADRHLSLLERAAGAYASRPAPARDPAPAPSAAPAPVPSAAPAPALSGPILDPSFYAIPEALRAPLGQELPDEVHIGVEDTSVAMIDRGMLAENGMIVPGAPVGPLAEEFRLVKRQLLITRDRVAEGDAPDKARTVLVCSARPEDGKTFCAVNLALSMAAERDTEVLLVDADVAKPDVMNRLGLDDAPGFLDALADPRIDVESLVRKTDVTGLSVLPAGTGIATDTELLASARTRAVIARLLDANPRRIVIFDSPPALAASPAAVLAMLVGQIMLIVRADRTPESELRQAVGLLDGCDHISLVLNAVSFVPGGHRFGTYYGKGQGK
jgi:exopolysaccharide/PEP-CTERM locus tyrosine autokinase